jgi:hypothetical protein
VSTSTSAPLVGATLGDRYEVVRHIARGGMGDVYEAKDTLLGRPVAVKVYRATAGTDRARFEAEVRTLASLNHPGLVQVYDAGAHDGDEYVILELVDGPTLSAAIRDRGPLPPGEVAALGSALATSLDYVHERGVVHRDVSPSNILRGSDGRPRLADFGIARLLDTTRVTAATSTIGTAAYMAPEQVEGRDVTPAADVYALGLVLREALTASPAFPGVGHEAALARLTRDPDVQTGIPEEWHDLLAEMTARDPEARPSAATVGHRLAALPAASSSAAPAAAAGAAVAGVAGAAALGAAATGGAADPAPDPDASVSAGAGAAAIDGEAVTEVVPTSGGTTVMPAALRPEPAPTPAPAPLPPSTAAADRGSRRALWVALAAIVLVLGIGLASQGDGGVEPATSTTEPVVTEVPTTVTTVPPTTQPPEDEGDGEGRPGKGKGKKDDD